MYCVLDFISVFQFLRYSAENPLFKYIYIVNPKVQILACFELKKCMQMRIFLDFRCIKFHSLYITLLNLYSWVITTYFTLYHQYLLSKIIAPPIFQCTCSYHTMIKVLIVMPKYRVQILSK